MAMSWFPIVIADRCDGCKGEFKCVSFCPNGVFEARDGRAWVVKPTACVPGCTSCAMLCPREAIIFPTERPMKATALSSGVRDKGLLHKVRCKGCGKIFWTNVEGAEYCFSCRRKMGLKRTSSRPTTG